MPVEYEDLFVFELVRHSTVHDPLRERVRESGLADARLAYKARIVLLTAHQNLDHTRNLGFTTDDPVEPALARGGGEILAVVVQKLALGILFLRAFLRLAFVLLLSSADARKLVRESAEDRAEIYRRGVVLLVVAHGGLRSLVPLLLNERVKIVFLAVHVVNVDAHVLQYVVYGQPELLCAVQAKPFVFRFVVFHSRHKYDRGSFVTS